MTRRVPPSVHVRKGLNRPPLSRGRRRGERHVGVGERSQAATVCAYEPSGRRKLRTSSYDRSFAFWRSNSSGVKIPWSRSAASLASSSATELANVAGPSAVTLSTGWVSIQA